MASVSYTQEKWLRQTVGLSTANYITRDAGNIATAYACGQAIVVTNGHRTQAFVAWLFAEDAALGGETPAFRLRHGTGADVAVLPALAAAFSYVDGVLP